jgi:hypothetical protein
MGRQSLEFISDEKSTAGFTSSEAKKAQLLYSWLSFTGMDEMKEIWVNGVNEE